MGATRKGTPNWRIHPGEILREEFLKPMGMSAYELAKRLLVPAPRINDIVLERRALQRIPQFASPDSSEPRSNSG